jgi:hypothetical protein
VAGSVTWNSAASSAVVPIGTSSRTPVSSMSVYPAAPSTSRTTAGSARDVAPGPGAGSGNVTHGASASRFSRRFSLSARSCQHRNASRPPVRRRLVNAATGSSKNITPNWLSTTSTCSNGVTWASASS